MPEIALSVSVRRPRLSLKTPVSKPVAIRAGLAPALPVDAAAEDQRGAVAAPGRDHRAPDMAQLAMRLKMLRESGLTGADASEEAANSLALGTRQAITASAHALARDSQVSILRLLSRSRDFS